MGAGRGEGLFILHFAFSILHLKAFPIPFILPAHMRIHIHHHLRVWLLVFFVFSSIHSYGQGNASWTRPIAPHHVIGNVYYVGSAGLASYLITTPAGNILINSSLESSVTLIRDSSEKLGFKFSDIKILLISHAHWDHCAGSAAIIKATGAKYMVMDGDVDVVESGGKTDFQYGESTASSFPVTKVDRMLHDNDEVKLGETTLVAHKTPGHTKGCTTWTLKASEGGKTYNVVIIGSPNVNPGYKLANNQKYPGIAEDYETMFRVLKSLPCDVFLGAHGDYYGMEDKIKRISANGPNPFIDPGGYKKYVRDKETTFRAELKRQQ